MSTDDAGREPPAIKARYHLTDAQVDRWRELIALPAAEWPKTLRWRAGRARA